mmetsp:Transcript_11153/g.16644  ORF Transcript_11153/g.16644 Transcript_11153/m.16644 type:complete len:214 (-) Transcript_11153:108-749(-)
MRCVDVVHRITPPLIHDQKALNFLLYYVFVFFSWAYQVRTAAQHFFQLLPCCWNFRLYTQPFVQFLDGSLVPRTVFRSGLRFLFLMRVRRVVSPPFVLQLESHLILTGVYLLFVPEWARSAFAESAMVCDFAVVLLFTAPHHACLVIDVALHFCITLLGRRRRGRKSCWNSTSSDRQERTNQYCGACENQFSSGDGCAHRPCYVALVLTILMR